MQSSFQRNNPAALLILLHITTFFLLAQAKRLSEINPMGAEKFNYIIVLVSKTISLSIIGLQRVLNHFLCPNHSTIFGLVA